MAEDPYSSWSDSELSGLAHGFSDGLFSGQVAIVTGGAGGIGRSICMLLSRLGARVVACGRDEEKLNHLKDSFASLDTEIFTLLANVRKPQEVAALVQETWEQHNRLDLVVNLPLDVLHP